VAGPFQLLCRKCNQSCQLGNPAKWHSGHKESAYKDRAAKLRPAGELHALPLESLWHGSIDGPISTGVWHATYQHKGCMRRCSSIRNFATANSGMGSFVANQQQQADFVDNLIKAMATGCVPFAFMENEYLKLFGARLGWDPG
jgi:hypothetical protein